MKNKLNSNAALKIISVLIALVLWLYIQMVANPETEHTFKNQTIELTNQTSLQTRNLSILGDGKFKSDITLKCKRWHLTELKKEGVLVYCDLSEIHDAGDSVLPVRVVVNNDKISVVNRSPASITVKTEKIITVDKPLSLNFAGKVKDGFYTDESMLDYDLKTVSVSGPESVVTKIKTGLATVNLNGKDSDFSEKCDIVLIDENGDVVSNGKVTLLNENVTVNCEVYSKKIVDIKLNGIPEDVEYEIIPSAVEIAGDAKNIENIDMLTQKDFVLESKKSGYKQNIELDVSEKCILITDASPYIVVKSVKEDSDN